MSNTRSKSNTMSKNSRMCNSMGNWVGNYSRMSYSMGNWVGNYSRMSNSMGNWVGKDSRVSYSMSNWVSYGSGILRFSFISHISNISIIVIGMVVDMLNTTIRKVDRVGTLYNTSTIIGLFLVECSTRVVISNSIGVRIGRGFSKVRLCISTNSMSNNRSMVDKRSVGNSYWMGYSMSNWSMNNSMTKSMN